MYEEMSEVLTSVCFITYMYEEMGSDICEFHQMNNKMSMGLDLCEFYLTYEEMSDVLISVSPFNL